MVLGGIEPVPRLSLRKNITHCILWLPVFSCLLLLLAFISIHYFTVACILRTFLLLHSSYKGLLMAPPRCLTSGDWLWERNSVGSEHRPSERDPFHQSNGWPKVILQSSEFTPSGCWLQRAVSKLLLTNEAQALQNAEVSGYVAILPCTKTFFLPFL